MVQRYRDYFITTIPEIWDFYRGKLRGWGIAPMSGAVGEMRSERGKPSISHLLGLFNMHFVNFWLARAYIYI